MNQGVNMPVFWCILNGSRAQGLLILDWRNSLSQSALSWHVPVKLVKNGVPPSFPTAYVPLQHMSNFCKYVYLYVCIIMCSQTCMSIHVCLHVNMYVYMKINLYQYLYQPCMDLWVC